MVVCEQSKARCRSRCSRVKDSIRHLILPEENAKEAAVVSGVNVYPVADLRSAVNLIADSAFRTIRLQPMKIDPCRNTRTNRTLQRRFQRSSRADVGEARAGDRDCRRS